MDGCEQAGFRTQSQVREAVGAASGEGLWLAQEMDEEWAGKGYDHQ